MRFNHHVTATDRPPLMELSARARELAAAGFELFRVDQGVVDVPPPAVFTEAVAAAIRGPLSHTYTPDPGLPELRAALARYADQRLGIPGYEPSQVVVTAGANQACFAALMALVSPGDEVLAPAPWYFNHAMTLTALGATPVALPTAATGGFVPAVADVEQAIGERTTGLLLVNPNNPTGASYPPQVVQRLTELCVDRGLWILADQTYHELRFGDEPPLSPAAVVGARDHVITICSFSKSLGLAGWRLGFVAAWPELVEEMLKIQDCSVICAGHAAQLGLLAALDVVGEHAALVVATLRDRRDRLLRALNEHRLGGFVEPGGSLFVFLRLPSGLDDWAFCRGLLESEQVVAVPGTAFGHAGAGHVRISFGSTPAARLEEAVERLAIHLAGCRG